MLTHLLWCISVALCLDPQLVVSRADPMLRSLVRRVPLAESEPNGNSCCPRTTRATHLSLDDRDLLRLCTCWLGKGISFVADLLEPKLMQSHTTVIIPLYKRIVVVGLLNCPEFSSRLSEIAKPSTRSPGFSSESGAGGWTSGGLLARSASAGPQRVTKAVAELCAVWVSVY